MIGFLIIRAPPNKIEFLRETLSLKTEKLITDWRKPHRCVLVAVWTRQAKPERETGTAALNIGKLRETTWACH